MGRGRWFETSRAHQSTCKVHLFGFSLVPPGPPPKPSSTLYFERRPCARRPDDRLRSHSHQAARKPSCDAALRRANRRRDYDVRRGRALGTCSASQLTFASSTSDLKPLRTTASAGPPPRPEMAPPSATDPSQLWVRTSTAGSRSAELTTDAETARFTKTPKLRVQPGRRLPPRPKLAGQPTTRRTAPTPA